MKNKKLPIGISDFKNMITGDYYYVDKTLFIKEVIDSGDNILLLPRPRRFGKTLNISMLGYFYDCCPLTWSPDSDSPAPTLEPQIPVTGNKNLFTSLAISQAGSEYMNKIGKYPVIFISFMSIKEETWESCWIKIKQLIRKEYYRHRYLLESPKLLAYEREYFQTILDTKGNIADDENSLENLLMFLTRFYNKRAVILIDEYDAPVHVGFTHDYYEKIIMFMRNFLSGGLKDKDQYLEKGVVTGIMRIAKESIFSGFNNPGVYTLLSHKFSDYFGFTETEVKTMLEDFQATDMTDQVQSWYNGYCFGDEVIYNPWSIINFLNDEKKKLKPYWLNTSDNQIAESLLSKGGIELRKELEQLISGESIEKVIDENIILSEIRIREDLLWSFLLMGGYLKKTAERQDEFSGKMHYTLSIPNKEVKLAYIGIIDRYFSTKIENEKLQIMLKALIEGDIPVFEKMLKQIVLAVFSYHDFGNEPEKVYHAFVAGLLIWITHTHEVRSNRESGYGRYDIMIIPKDLTKIGYVIEFKSVDPEANETVESALKAALAQIEEKQYETELKARGVTRIKKLAIAFLGKEVSIKSI